MWDLYFLCFAKPHLQKNILRLPHLESYPKKYRAALFPPPSPRVKTSQSRELPSLGLSAHTSAAPNASSFLFTTGGGTPGHTPLRRNPLQIRSRGNPTARVDSASCKHKNDPEHPPCSSAGSCWLAPPFTAHARSQALRRRQPVCRTSYRKNGPSREMRRVGRAAGSTQG